MKKITSLFIILIICLKFSYSQTNYLILTTVTDTTDTYYSVVKRLQNYRQGQVLQFNANDVQSLFTNLFIIKPRYVALVMKPVEIDINFVRKFLMLSTNIDPDPFSDFSYGFITGATGQDALNFVNKIILADSVGIQNYPLNVGGYAASSLNFVFPGCSDYMKYLNPPNANIIYLETNDNNTGHDFFMQNTSYMQNCKVLDIGHNGDPHMLWLFEGGNTSPDPPVWNYDTLKIEDTAYARAGLTSYDVVSLNLFPAVAFNGACHSGETKRVMVEGDIAATFGETNGITQFYTMSDPFSFCLSMLKTGITGYFAPCGANNANDQAEDMYNAFLYNEPLGDIHKRSNDGVVMGFLGNRANLKIYVQGEYFYGCDVLTSGTFNPSQWSGACYMLGGKANRIYYGDPLYNPYQNNHSTLLNLTHYTIDSVNNQQFDITLDYHKPDVSEAYYPVWDKFHYSKTRIYTPILLPLWCNNVSSLNVLNSTSAYSNIFHAFEDFDGKKILHVEVDIPDDMYDSIDFSIKFRIGLSMGIENKLFQTIQNLEIYPNPVNDKMNISFYNLVNHDIKLNIIDITGKIVQSINCGNLLYGPNNIPLDLKGLNSGLYFIQLISPKDIITQKFLYLP